MTLPMSDADYQAIESAVMETARGQWFLAEYARRTRQAETDLMREALQRIEDKIDTPARDPHFERMQMSIMEMAQAIARTKDEIAAIKPTQEVDGRFGEATEELDAIVTTTETATGDILHAAEQIQEVAWTLRERGFEGPICDLLDERATDIYTACSFQDLTGQRTRKVIGVLRYLEARINAMIDIWGLDGAPVARAGATARPAPDAADKADAPLGRQLANGPALPGMGLEQTSIDAMLGGLDAGEPDAELGADLSADLDADLDFARIAIDDADFAAIEPAATAEDAAEAAPETDENETADNETGDRETADESAIVEAVVETIEIDDIVMEAVDIDRFNLDTVEVPAIEMDLVAVDVELPDEVDLPDEDAGAPQADGDAVETATGDMAQAIEAPSIAADLDSPAFPQAEAGADTGETGDVDTAARARMDRAQVDSVEVDSAEADSATTDIAAAAPDPALVTITAPFDSLMFDIVAIDVEPLDHEPSEPTDTAPEAATTETATAETAAAQEKIEEKIEEKAEMATTPDAPSLAPVQPAARLSTAEIDRLAPAERIALFS
jgi:chemotaxis regulatin CheY-phosphate phosphatase CheZ